MQFNGPYGNHVQKKGLCRRLVRLVYSIRENCRMRDRAIGDFLIQDSSPDSKGLRVTNP